MVLNDFDFVPMFRYELSQPVAVSNVTISGFLKTKYSTRIPISISGRYLILKELW